MSVFSMKSGEMTIESEKGVDASIKQGDIIYLT